MAHEPTDPNPAAGILIRRRTLLGLALAAGVLGPLVGAGTARADSGATDSEEYPIPDGIGSAPWW